MKPIRRLHQNLFWVTLHLGVFFSLHAADNETPHQLASAEINHPPEIGRDIYNFYCYFCHGYSGDAQTLASKFLTPAPRNFRNTDPKELTHDQAKAAISNGRPGTAMMPYGNVLSGEEIKAVAEYIRSSFIRSSRSNTKYHTEENGWFNHDRFAESYPFATGEIPLDTPTASLSDAQRRGLRVYIESCISCHDRSKVNDPNVIWESVAISYPRIGFQAGDSLLPPDALSGATPFARHDIVPSIPNLSSIERIGEKLYQDNCAFCHAADGTGKNWIGTFLEPHPRDLTNPDFMASMTEQKLKQVIRNGLTGTSMPAWKSVFNDAEINAVVHYIHRVIHPLSGFDD